ncbi:hypothetical protein DSO57_1002705 [Entomophthora muscae]|uniref:Uncharacterized protein n=1 Tax=Entomophthora muscae TaxID=34485 RepID=A0ACC2UIN3_9FUNG|nr:hypothetical protein DSO57_1002705 [Entomophthora muscae]
MLGLANQVMTHTESWRPWATAVNHLERLSPIVYMAFQFQPAFPVGVQLDSGMSCDSERQLHVQFVGREEDVRNSFHVIAGNNHLIVEKKESLLPSELAETPNNAKLVGKPERKNAGLSNPWSKFQITFAGNSAE